MVVMWSSNVWIYGSCLIFFSDFQHVNVSRLLWNLIKFSLQTSILVCLDLWKKWLTWGNSQEIMERSKLFVKDVSLKPLMESYIDLKSWRWDSSVRWLIIIEYITAFYCAHIGSLWQPALVASTNTRFNYCDGLAVSSLRTQIVHGQLTAVRVSEDISREFGIWLCKPIYLG